MYMKNIFLLLSWLILLPSGILANPIKGMLERIDKGASNKFVVELHKSPNDFFELDRKGDKVVIRGNTYINIATGINWYLKYHAGIHLSWNGMYASLPDVLGLETLGKGTGLDGTTRNQPAARCRRT